MVREACSGEISVSRPDEARVVGGTQDENHPERMDNLEDSATKYRYTRTTRSRSWKNISLNYVFSMLGTI